MTYIPKWTRTTLLKAIKNNKKKLFVYPLDTYYHCVSCRKYLVPHTFLQGHAICKDCCDQLKVKAEVMVWSEFGQGVRPPRI